MPFKSEAQRAFLFARRPEIARRWAREYPNPGPLPARVGSHARVVDVLAARKMPKGGY